MIIFFFVLVCEEVGCIYGDYLFGVIVSKYEKCVEDYKRIVIRKVFFFNLNYDVLGVS